MSSIQNSWRYINLVDDLLHCLDMDRRGVSGQVIGNYLSELIARCIINQVAKEKEPDGTRLAPLSPKYRLWKILHGFNQAILRKTDAMLEFQQVKGLVMLSTHEMRMYYGVDPDCEYKAEMAHEGAAGGRGMSYRIGKKGKPQTLWQRPPRPFYDINKECWETIDLCLDLEIDSEILAHGAKRLP